MAYSSYNSNNDYEEPKSKFNAAISAFYRLDLLWKNASEHARKQQYVKWNLDLDAVFRELSEDCNDDDENNFDLLNGKIIAAGLYQVQVSNGFNKATQSQVVSNATLYYLLHKKEIFLRKLQNKQGKGTAYEDSIEDYMD